MNDNKATLVLDKAICRYGAKEYPLGGLPDIYNGNEKDILDALIAMFGNLGCDANFKADPVPAYPGFGTGGVCIHNNDYSVAVWYKALKRMPIKAHSAISAARGEKLLKSVKLPDGKRVTFCWGRRRY